MRAPPRRPFRFSSPISGAVDRTTLVERSKQLEDLGYSTATIADHFNEQLAPFSALMAIAESTTTLHIAPFVLCNDYRHPVIVAKETATLDLLSEGRLEVGFGAGWMETDYEKSGMSFDPPSVRVARMEESLAIVRSLWRDEEVDFKGEHYQIDGLRGTPRPVQDPGPRIIIGGGGRRVLEVAAREADIIGFNPRMHAGRIDERAGPSATPAATDQKLGWIHDAAADRWDDLELQVRLELAILTDEPDPLYEELSGPFGLTPDEARGTPHAIAGPIPSMVEQLIERRERWGLSYIGIPYDSALDFAPLVSALAGT